MNKHIARLTEEQKQDKIARAEHYYGKFMSSLGFEWETDPNASETPHRVAKAWVNDLAEGCFNHPPKITAFDNGDEHDKVDVITYGHVNLKD